MTMTTDPRTAAFRAVGPLPDGHPQVRQGKIGVLLTNLGTPDGTDYWPMRRYLKEFLSDRRVIDTPRLLWWPILNLIILSIRPQKKGKDYASIWNNELNESFLKTITRDQAKGMAEVAKELDDRIIVDWAMRYGNPSIKSRMEALQEQGCDRVLVIPLYPQYAAATSATACDKTFEVLMNMRWQPTLRISPPYHDEPAYIDALATSVRKHLDSLDFEPEVILTSFHGVPKRYLMLGDPYHCHCYKTWRLLREALGRTPETMMISFQSRFGPEEWLQPYTDKTVEALAKKGIKRMAIIAPGFSSDCLETLEELDGENREIFLHNGGEQFSYIPCLNASEEGLKVIETIMRRELMGWI
jgi:ferrochelatase